MSSHDFLVPLMAAAFMVINLLGAAFTILRGRSQRMQQANRYSPAMLRQFAWANGFFVAAAGAAFAVVEAVYVLGLW